MNSLLKNHCTPPPDSPAQQNGDSTCWELLGCSKMLCPAHGRNLSDCWLIPRTHCTMSIQEDFFDKLSSCLSCVFFKAKGMRHPRGWNHFLSEQIHRYNSKALEQLYQKEESFVEILNRIPDGLFTTDYEFRITYFNPAAERITGFSAVDAIGMYCKDVFKNTICECDCALKKAIAENRSIHNREYEIFNIEGNRVPIICSTSAFVDDNGRITGGLEIFKDITELKRLQEEIVRRERKYRRIFEGSHDMIYTTNLQGTILDVNPAGVEMMGFDSREELMEACSASELYRNPEDRQKFLRLITSEGYVKDYEVDFSTRKRFPLHVLISSRRYSNPETGDVEFEGIIKDITHRKLTEEDLKQRNRELSILNSIAVALNDNMDLSHILKRTLKNVIKVLRLKKGAVFLIDRAEKQIRLEAACGLPRPASSAGCDLEFKDVVLGNHLLESSIKLKPKPSFPMFQVRYMSRRDKPAEWLTCFIITSKGKSVGFFALYLPPERTLDEHEIHLMGSLGNFLGGTIENTQLMDTVRRHRQELRRLTEKLFKGQEEERRRIARELHDETGQSLTAVKLALERLEQRTGPGGNEIKKELGEVVQMVKRTASEIRRLSYHLHPTLLIDLGLEPALRLYIKEIQSRANMAIDFNIIGFDQRLDPDMETVLYRFSQECLTNAIKHANAENFRLSIIRSFPKIIFVAEDDGVGFDTELIGKDKKSLGLLGMRERIALLDGNFFLKTVPNEGTRIRIEISVAEEKKYVKHHPHSVG